MDLSGGVLEAIRENRLTGLALQPGLRLSELSPHLCLSPITKHAH